MGGAGVARIALGLAVAPLVTIGLARFSYALLLPAMRADLGWSYAEAGAMNTANAAGYLAGAMIAASVAARIGARRAFLGGMLVTALALAASCVSGALPWLLAWRVLAGFAGAVAFVVGAGLAAAAATHAPRPRQGLVVATYFGGGGAGVLVASAIVPPVLELGGFGWRLGWLAMGAAALAALALAWIAVPARAVAASPLPETQGARTGDGTMTATYLAYLLFGAGYIGYMTFIIALLRTASVSPGMIAAFWAVLGLASMASCFGWGEVFARLHAGRPMLVAMLVIAAGASLPLLTSAGAGLFGSAVLFGAGVMAMPAAVTVVARNALPPDAWTAALGRLTVVFGLGQCAGPIASGALADSAAGIATGLAASAILLVAGAAVALCQR
jgi:predicted MFS family arabinose efflux permease